MSDYKHEYQKFADSAVKSREQEEGFGRLRLAVFLAAAGPLAIFLTRVLHYENMPRWMAIGIVALAPLSVVLMIIRTTDRGARSEEHTSELQSQSNLVCR